MNVKEAIKICTPHLQERFLHYENVYDVAVAEYLLQPLKNTYVAEDLASEYLGISVPGYGRPLAREVWRRHWKKCQRNFAPMPAMRHISAAVWLVCSGKA